MPEADVEADAARTALNEGRPGMSRLGRVLGGPEERVLFVQSARAEEELESLPRETEAWPWEVEWDWERDLEWWKMDPTALAPAPAPAPLPDDSLAPALSVDDQWPVLDSSAKMTFAAVLDLAGRLMALPTRRSSPALAAAMVSVRDGDEPREKSRVLVTADAWAAAVGAARTGE